MTEARVNPEGYVAQRMTKDGKALWVLIYLDANDQLTVQLLTDDEVADWPQLQQVGDH